MIAFVMFIVVAAAVGFVIGVIVGGPIAGALLGYGAPYQLQSISLAIGMLMAAAFGSFVYYMGEFFEVKQVPTAFQKREHQELFRRLKESPEDPKLHLELARSFRPESYNAWMRSWDHKHLDRNALKAKAEYIKATKLQPSLLDAHLELGMLYHALYRLRERKLAGLDALELARKEFLKALEIDPQCFEAHKNIGITLRYMKDYVKAEEHLRKALELCSDDRAKIVNWWLGIMFEKDIGDTNKAIEEFRKIFPEYDSTLHEVKWTSGAAIWDPNSNQSYFGGFELIDKVKRRHVKTEPYRGSMDWLD